MQAIAMVESREFERIVSSVWRRTPRARFAEQESLSIKILDARNRVFCRNGEKCSHRPVVVL
jgi:hypothetical protein